MLYNMLMTIKLQANVPYSRYKLNTPSPDSMVHYKLHDMVTVYVVGFSVYFYSLKQGDYGAGSIFLIESRLACNF